MEPDRDSPVARRIATFACPAGHEFELPFAHDAELPGTWECRGHGLNSPRLAAAPTARVVKPPRTHWDMLLERRSIADLEVLLDEALYKLRMERQAAV